MLKRYLPIKTYPSILDAVWCLLPRLKQYDVVVATTTGIAFFLVFWKIFYRFRFAIVGLMIAMMNYPLNHFRIKLSSMLLKRMDVHLFGEGEAEPIRQENGVPRDKLTVNYFGVDSTFWQSNCEKNEGQYILSIGNDSMRDFALLIEVAKRVKKKVILVTSRQIYDEIPENMEILSGAWHSQEISDFVLRDIVRNDFCVAVLLKQTFQPSGQSVTLQAMACGKPVILTKTPGICENVHLKHGENILLVEPGNLQQVTDCLKVLEDNAMKSSELGRNARQYVLNHGRIDFFAEWMEVRIRNRCKKRWENV